MAFDLTPCSCIMCGMPVFNGEVIDYHRGDIQGVTYTHRDECLNKTNIYLQTMGMVVDEQTSVVWNKITHGYI